MKNITSRNTKIDFVAALRLSPIHNISPISENPKLIEIEKIEIDPTNPGRVIMSKRDERRRPSVRDSYDILGRIIYPIIVSKKNDDKYELIDGHARFNEARGRGQEKIHAIVFPEMTLEQRICLRETLNAAQEPFDAASIIADLSFLAKERRLDISNPEDIKTLLRDFPERVRNHEKDLLILSRWHPEAVKLLGESYTDDENTIGLDKFRGLNSILATMEKLHPQTVEMLGGAKELSLKLASMYNKRKFSDGVRSQEGIRRVVKLLKSVDSDDRVVREFFRKEKGYSELPQIVDEKAKENVIDLSKRLRKLLSNIEAEELTSDEYQELRRTWKVLDQVLYSAS